LTADGKRFAHPLHHLGKSEKDLPIIAIDSFRHMYLFPDASEMEQYGKLKKFIADLHSGRLTDSPRGFLVLLRPSRFP